MSVLIKRLRQRLCNHRFKYIAPCYRLRDRKVIAYEYECVKCGTVMIVPKIEEAEHDEVGG